MPMIYMLSTSLRPNGALYEFPPHFFQLSEITLENYRYIFAQEKFYLNFINSVIVAVITIVLAAIIASALAYCLARFEFPGKKLLFALVIGMMIIPGTTLIIPQFQLASFFGITNSLAGLIPFYVAWVIPFSTFMIKKLHRASRASLTRRRMPTAGAYSRCSSASYCRSPALPSRR